MTPCAGNKLGHERSLTAPGFPHDENNPALTRLRQIQMLCQTVQFTIPGYKSVCERRQYSIVFYGR